MSGLHGISLTMVGHLSDPSTTSNPSSYTMYPSPLPSQSIPPGPGRPSLELQLANLIMLVQGFKRARAESAKSSGSSSPLAEVYFAKHLQNRRFPGPESSRLLHRSPTVLLQIRAGRPLPVPSPAFAGIVVGEGPLPV
jgi:hypothetical protein